MKQFHSRRRSWLLRPSLRRIALLLLRALLAPRRRRRSTGCPCSDEAKVLRTSEWASLSRTRLSPSLIASPGTPARCPSKMCKIRCWSTIIDPMETF
ncbi:hypothetical protein NL676_021060 [Syzygium grande]|nr:hypothetical protein NL676_021060 [Syzygium grande]